MSKFLSILAAIDTDSKVAIEIAQKAAPVIALAGPIGSEINAVIAALAALEEKLP